MIWYHGRFWRYDGWATAQEWNGPRKMQRSGRYRGYIQLTDESNGEVRRIRSDCVIINAEAIA